MIGYYILGAFAIMCMCGIKAIDPSIVYRNDHYRIRKIGNRFIVEMSIIPFVWTQICDDNENYHSFGSQESAMKYLVEETKMSDGLDQ